MIIDVHAHIFPDKIAEKAAESVGKFYGYDLHGNGTVDNLLFLGDEAGVDKFVVHSVAMTPSHVDHVNQFTASAVKAHPDRLIGFMTLHPNMERMEDSIDRALELGLKGVKLHPDMQRFAADSEEARPMFRRIASRKLPVMLHAGDRRYHFSTPAQILALKQAVPDLTLIAAHYGGHGQWEESARLLPHSGVWVDCSSSFYWLTSEQARSITRLFGSSRIMFGSDFPMFREKDELERLRNLGLTHEELENILHKTAEQLLGL